MRIFNNPVFALYTHSRLVSAVVLSAGLLLCMWAAWGAGQACDLRECSLYRNATVFGVSLFVWGAGLFTLLILLLPTWQYPQCSLLAVAADVPLLAWQAMMGPCGKCLAVAALLLLNACLALHIGPPLRARKAIVGTAAVLLVFNILTLALEAGRPWVVRQVRSVEYLEELRPFLPLSRQVVQ